MYDMKSAGSSLCTGTMLCGRYRIEKVLGQGGFGITYAALDTRHYCRVAVKELFPSSCVTRAANQRTVSIAKEHADTFRHLLESFEKEANTLIKLQNQEGVVRLMHVFSENSTMYYVMELLEGQDLRHRLSNGGTMDWEELAPILKTVMSALAQLHTVGLIHRDISPDNIFLTPDGARLIDFGSVRNYQGNTLLTALVKQNFAPIEQFLSSGHQGPWTDIYALSVTVYFALTGKLPPRSLNRKYDDQLVPLDVHCPQLPEYICSAIHRGMAVQPEQRFQTIPQFAAALRLSSHTPTTPLQSARLVCNHGYFVGKSWNLQPDSILRIGRNPNCDICYPAKYPGVSRDHCEIILTSDGAIYVRDCNSTYGTKLKGAGKFVALEPGVWYRADGAHVLFQPQEDYVLTR